jgi:hypothetical protein
MKTKDKSVQERRLIFDYAKLSSEVVVGSTTPLSPFHCLLLLPLLVAAVFSVI